MISKGTTENENMANITCFWHHQNQIRFVLLHSILQWCYSMTADQFHHICDYKNIDTSGQYQRGSTLFKY